MSDLSRRTFFQGAALAASATRVIGANDRINVGIVGLGRRGTKLTEYCAGFKDCRVAALCDVNQAARERTQAQLKKQDPTAHAKDYVDMRDVFADKDIDAVFVPVPVHWHALAMIWACEAGKDVYAEKPASYNIYEGRRMIETARKHKRMVQVGLQARSAPHKIRAMELLHGGAIGKVYLAKGLCFKRRPTIGKTPPEPVPPGVNWDLFLGPAPMRPFTRNRFGYSWNWFWDTGAGDITNAGAHEMDLCRWGLGDPGMANGAFSSGGKYVYDDDQEAPNTQLSTFDYGGREMVFEIRGLVTGPEAGLPVRTGLAPLFGELQPYPTVGNLFLGDGGWMWMDDSGFRLYKGESNELAVEEKASGPSETWQKLHVRNFLQVCRSRNPKEFRAPLEVGVMSAAVSHMATISYRLGRKVVWDHAKDRFLNDPEADKLMTRDYRKPYVV